MKSGAVLWSHTYPKEGPTVESERPEGNLVLSWPVNSDGAKLEIKNNPLLSARWPRMDAGGDDYFLEVVEPRTGKVIGASIVRSGKGAFRIRNAESAGDWLVVSDSTNRLLVYSVKSGEQTGILFGRRPRTKTPAQVCAELDALHATGYQGLVFIVDDNFIGNKREVRRLLEGIGAEKAGNAGAAAPSPAPRKDRELTGGDAGAPRFGLAGSALRI